MMCIVAAVDFSRCRKKKPPSWCSLWKKWEFIL